MLSGNAYGRESKYPVTGERERAGKTLTVRRSRRGRQLRTKGASRLGNAEREWGEREIGGSGRSREIRWVQLYQTSRRRNRENVTCPGFRDGKDGSAELSKKKKRDPALFSRLFLTGQSHDDL